jgi:hypothetical protein
MGSRWGAGKENGEGGGQYTSNLGPEWTGIAPHAKEGFQVSKRDSGTGRDSLGRRGLSRGIVKGLSRGLCHVLQYSVNPVHIVLIVCMSC